MAQNVTFSAARHDGSPRPGTTSRRASKQLGPVRRRAARKSSSRRCDHTLLNWNGRPWPPILVCLSFGKPLMHLSRNQGLSFPEPSTRLGVRRIQKKGSRADCWRQSPGPEVRGRGESLDLVAPPVTSPDDPRAARETMAFGVTWLTNPPESLARLSIADLPSAIRLTAGLSPKQGQRLQIDRLVRSGYACIQFESPPVPHQRLQ